MAETITLEQGEAEQAAREQEFAQRNNQQRLAQSKAEQRVQAAAERGRSRLPAAPVAIDPAQMAAQQAYTKGWQYTQEVLEDAALSFADLMLFTGPAAVAMFVLRIGGTLNNGFGDYTFQGFTVKRVPGYGWVEGIYRSIKILAIGLFSGFIWSTLITVVYFITHPQELLRLGLASFSSMADILSTFGTALINGVF